MSEAPLTQQEADELRQLFTEDQVRMLLEGRRALAGRSGEIVLRYTRSGLHAIRYKLPGQVATFREAVARLREAGGYGEIVITPCREGRTDIQVIVSREFKQLP